MVKIYPLKDLFQQKNRVYKNRARAFTRTEN